MSTLGWTANPIVLPFQPTPLQARIFSREAEGGEVVRNFHITWRAGDGMACRRCPRDVCNLRRVPGSDTATCHRVLRGEPSDRLAAALSAGA